MACKLDKRIGSFNTSKGNYRCVILPKNPSNIL